MCSPSGIAGAEFLRGACCAVAKGSQLSPGTASVLGQVMKHHYL